jgi:hypothetical protein
MAISPSTPARVYLLIHTARAHVHRPPRLTPLTGAAFLLASLGLTL